MLEDDFSYAEEVVAEPEQCQCECHVVRPGQPPPLAARQLCAVPLGRPELAAGQADAVQHYEE